MTFQVPRVLAAIFALWSVQFYLKTVDPTSSNDQPTMQGPHAVQVLCILRLLGVAAANGAKIQLANHLAEVPTGEGKSVVLAVTAATLALYGYCVDCVCYSGNLSSRDHEMFKSLFECLGLKEDQIRFSLLAERLAEN